MMAKLGGTIASLLAGLGAKGAANPRSTSWVTVGLGVLGIMGVSPDTLRNALAGICNLLMTVANAIPG